MSLVSQFLAMLRKVLREKITFYSEKHHLASSFLSLTEDVAHDKSPLESIEMFRVWYNNES